MTEREIMVRVTDVTKTFEGRTVLGGVNASFERGKVSTLVGPSGGGKSTLLRCINGLERFDRGRIDIGGIEVGPGVTSLRPPRHERQKLREVRLKAGMVFQHYGLFAHMTALQNVIEAPVHVRGIPLATARERGKQLLDRVGLSHRRDAFPRELSGGEQQRVAIARALAMDPEALLLDEPTSALDPDRKAEVIRVIHDLAKGGATMIIVTHEPAIVRDIADHAVCLRDGRIVGEGAPADVT